MSRVTCRVPPPLVHLLHSCSFASNTALLLLTRPPPHQDNERQMRHVMSQFPPNSGLPWTVLRMIIKTKHNGIPSHGAAAGIAYTTR